MKIALVGYSQGGMVVSSAIAKIPADQMKNVVALVLYGAGNGAGGGTPAGTGGAAPSDAVKGMTLANCAPADMVSFFWCLGIGPRLRAEGKGG